MEFIGYRCRELRERGPVQVVDRGGEHEHRQQQPAQASGIGGAGHWNAMVATSPTVARRALGLGKYSMVTRRAFCTPQPRLCSPPPEIAIWPGSVTSSFTILRSSPSTSRRACLPRQSTCLRLPLSLPDGAGPSHHGTAFGSDFGAPPLALASRACTSARAWALSLSNSRASSSAWRLFSASS